MAILTNTALLRHFIRGGGAAVLVSAIYGGALEANQWVLPARTATWINGLVTLLERWLEPMAAMGVRSLFGCRV